MRKFIGILAIIAIIGALFLGISKVDIFMYIAIFFKNLSIWVLKFVKEFADELQTRFAQGVIFLPF